LFSVYELVLQRRMDAPVAEARFGLLSGQKYGRKRADDGQDFDSAAADALGFTLPHDWNGNVQIQGNVTQEVDGQPVVSSALAKGVPAESWGVYTQLTDGSYTQVAEKAREQDAKVLAERLALIDAHATLNEHEKAVKLARINEERVRSDPNSTDEDIAVAREARKNAEFAATTNDEDLQRRIQFEERERAQQAIPGDSAAAQDRGNARTLIDVPYKQKEEAKALGAKWDRQAQSWYVPAGVDAAPFTKWAQNTGKAAAGAAQSTPATSHNQGAPKLVEDRQYLAIPYSERVAAKAAGAEWDKAAKSWYAGPTADLAKLAKWEPGNVPGQQAPAMTPREEFAEALKSVGCVISGEHPIMDGKKHRITVEGENFTKNSGSGFYVGHLDGHPAGYMKNNKTGVEANWKSKGYVLDPEQKASMAAQAAAKLQQREANQSRRQNQAAIRVVKQLDKLLPVTQPTAYMLAKGITPQAGAFTDKDGKQTFLPVIDVDGKQWSTQYIQEDGTKRFAKPCRRTHRSGAGQRK